MASPKFSIIEVGMHLVFSQIPLIANSCLIIVEYFSLLEKVD